MVKKSMISLFKESLVILLLAMLGCLGIVFSVLYIDTFNYGFISDFSQAIIAICVGVISCLTIFTIVFFRSSHKAVFKILFIVSALIVVVTVTLYFLKKSGFLNKINSIDKFRDYVCSFGNYAIIFFIIIQFLQVVVLPIPSFITVGGGVLLFGAFYGALYSSIGIIIGSLVAFFIGRLLGVKLTKWIIGENGLKKGLALIEGKDKIALIFMFLFPMFPDDLLCFVAGVTSMSTSFFIVMTIATRIISVFAASFSINNSLIPYDTWWGILLWICFFLLTFIIMIFVFNKKQKR